VGTDGLTRWLEMSRSVSLGINFGADLVILDALLAFCDVEGNFTVVKVKRFFSD